MSMSPTSSKNYSRLSEIDKNKQNCEQKLKISGSGTFLRMRNPVDVLPTDQPTVATVQTPTPFICNSRESLRATPISGPRHQPRDVMPIFDVTPAHDPRTTQSHIVQRHNLSVCLLIAILHVPQYYNLRTTLILSYLTQKGENITIFCIQQSKILSLTTPKMLKHNYLSQLLKNQTIIYQIQPK